MDRMEDLQRQLEQAKTEVGYLKRTIARLQRRLERQEKLDDMNRYQTKWAIKQVDEARRQAEQANKAKTEFLANMSHEIRTPLNIVLGMGELLAGTELNGSQSHYLQSLRLSSEHLCKLIDDILEFSRIESGSVEVDPSPFDLGQLLMGIEAMGSHLASGKGLAFHLECDQSLDLKRVGDARRIRQVLLNLLDNGVKFTDTGTVTLSVSGERDGDPEQVVFTVSDTGIGIPEAKHGIIFERFAQIETGRLKNKSGVGLGLAICERLVTAMGGRICIDSQVDKGSSFSVRIRLPFATKAEQPSGEMEIDDGGFPWPSLRLLVVDDINLNFEVIREYVKDLAVHLDYADNGKHAVKAFGNSTYDLVLMDIRMPVMDGVDAVRNLRRLERFKRAAPTPIIAMTAHAFTEQAHTYLEAGFDEVLIKPFSRKDLLSVLRRHLKPGKRTAEQSGETDRQPAFHDDSANTLEALLPRVLAEIAQEIVVIKEALHDNDQDQVKKTGHAVRGLAGFYGLTQLSDLLTHLEKSVHRREYRTAQALAAALANHVDELKVRMHS